MRLSVRLLPQLHSSIKYGYCMILMKRYAWILTKKKLVDLYITFVRSIDYFFVTSY